MQCDFFLQIGSLKQLRWIKKNDSAIILRLDIIGITYIPVKPFVGTYRRLFKFY